MNPDPEPCLYPFCGQTKGRSLYIRVTFPGDDGKKRTWEKVGFMCDKHLTRVVKQMKMTEVRPTPKEIVIRPGNKAEKDKSEEEEEEV